jgi:hypothetical protein
VLPNDLALLLAEAVSKVRHLVARVVALCAAQVEVSRTLGSAREKGAVQILPPLGSKIAIQLRREGPPVQALREECGAELSWLPPSHNGSDCDAKRTFG